MRKVRRILVILASCLLAIGCDDPANAPAQNLGEDSGAPVDFPRNEDGGHVSTAPDGSTGLVVDLGSARADSGALEQDDAGRASSVPAKPYSGDSGLATTAAIAFAEIAIPVPEQVVVVERTASPPDDSFGGQALPGKVERVAATADNSSVVDHVGGLAKRGADGTALWAVKREALLAGNGVYSTADGSLSEYGSGGVVLAHKSTNSAQSDTGVTALRADGSLAWTTWLQIPFANARSISVRTTANGSTYVAGTTSIQLPGEPVEAKGMPFIARLDESGQVVWIHQARGNLWAHPPALSSDVVLAVDDSRDEAHVVISQPVRFEVDTPAYRVDQTYALLRATSSGDLSYQDLPTEADSFTERVTSIASGGGRIYLLGSLKLASYGADGRLVWGIKPNVGSTSTIDEVEGVLSLRTGQLRELHWFDGQVVAIASLTTRFENGSVKRPEFDSVGRVTFDADGTPRSMNQYRVGPLLSESEKLTTVFLDSSSSRTGTIAIAVQRSASPTMMATAIRWYTFVVDGAGTPL